MNAALDWLGNGDLDRLWDLLKERLERNGLQVRGRLRLADPSDGEREALALLMGRRYGPGPVTLALADLDAELRSGATGQGLVEVVRALRGPLTDRPALRDARRSATASVWQAAEQALTANGLSDLPWVPAWLEETKRGGGLARVPTVDAVRLITQAIAVLGSLRPAAPVGRGELAERVTGTAHGLDDDTFLSRLVLRGLAHALDAEPPKDARSRRELWQAAGVTTDAVSSTVLTYGLLPAGDFWRARQLRERAAHHAETHLTSRDLRQMAWLLPPGTEVHVCENPRVVEAASDARCARALVCTSGNPDTTVLTLLDALASAGARFAYRGDFDWPGVAIAARMIRRYGARPWRMSAADYEEHVAVARERGTPLQPLSGSPVEAWWDLELTPAMRSLGVGVQEESALELLLSDLA